MAVLQSLRGAFDGGASLQRGIGCRPWRRTGLLHCRRHLAIPTVKLSSSSPQSGTQSAHDEAKPAEKTKEDLSGADEDAKLLAFIESVNHRTLLSTDQELELVEFVQRLASLEELFEAYVADRGEEPSDEQWAAEAGISGREIAAVRQQGHAAYAALSRRHAQLVTSLATKYSGGCGMELEELVGEGMVGLKRGVERYDPEGGYRLSTSMYWWIRYSISRSICLSSPKILHALEESGESSDMQRLAATFYEAMRKVKRAEALLESELGWQPTAEAPPRMPLSTAAGAGASASASKAASLKEAAEKAAAAAAEAAAAKAAKTDKADAGKSGGGSLGGGGPAVAAAGGSPSTPSLQASMESSMEQEELERLYEMILELQDSPSETAAADVGASVDEQDWSGPMRGDGEEGEGDGGVQPAAAAGGSSSLFEKATTSKEDLREAILEQGTPGGAREILVSDSDLQTLMDSVLGTLPQHQARLLRSRWGLSAEEAAAAKAAGQAKQAQQRKEALPNPAAAAAPPAADPATTAAKEAPFQQKKDGQSGTSQEPLNNVAKGAKASKEAKGKGTMSEGQEAEAKEQQQQQQPGEPLLQAPVEAAQKLPEAQGGAARAADGEGMKASVATEPTAGREGDAGESGGGGTPVPEAEAAVPKPSLSRTAATTGSPKEGGAASPGQEGVQGGGPPLPEDDPSKGLEKPPSSSAQQGGSGDSSAPNASSAPPTSAPPPSIQQPVPAAAQAEAPAQGGQKKTPTPSSPQPQTASSDTAGTDAGTGAGARRTGGATFLERRAGGASKAAMAALASLEERVAKARAQRAQRAEQLAAKAATAEEALAEAAAAAAANPAFGREPPPSGSDQTKAEVLPRTGSAAAAPAPAASPPPAPPGAPASSAPASPAVPSPPPSGQPVASPTRDPPPSPIAPLPTTASAPAAVPPTQSSPPPEQRRPSSAQPASPAGASSAAAAPGGGGAPGGSGAISRPLVYEDGSLLFTSEMLEDSGASSSGQQGRGGIRMKLRGTTPRQAWGRELTQFVRGNQHLLVRASSLQQLWEDPNFQKAAATVLRKWMDKRDLVSERNLDMMAAFVSVVRSGRRKLLARGAAAPGAGGAAAAGKEPSISPQEALQRISPHWS